MKISLFILFFLISIYAFSQTNIYIIGTVHEKSLLINSDSMIVVLQKIKPDAIFCEMEEQFFTTEHKFDVAKYPGIETATNENVAAYKYQLDNEIELRSYESEGRNEFYSKNNYFKRQNNMFKDVMTAYENKTLSPESFIEWATFLELNIKFDILKNKSLTDINSPLSVYYSEIKNLLTFGTFLSICKRDFPQHLEFANLQSDYWRERNKKMSDNIDRLCKDFPNKKIVIFCGQQHKYILTDYLKSNNNIKVLSSF